MFLKLKNSIHIGKYKKLDVQAEFGKLVDGKFMGLRYHRVDACEYVEQLTRPIPQRYRSDFHLCSIETNQPIYPHTDSDVLTVINYYIESGNCITNFYKIKNFEEQYKTPGQTTGSTFPESSLIPIGNFVAQNREAWLLDVSIPHSVYPLGDGPVNRYGLTLQTMKYRFDEVKEMLMETNSI